MECKIQYLDGIPNAKKPLIGIATTPEANPNAVETRSPQRNPDVIANQQQSSVVLLFF